MSALVDPNVFDDGEPRTVDWLKCLMINPGMASATSITYLPLASQEFRSIGKPTVNSSNRLPRTEVQCVLIWHVTLLDRPVYQSPLRPGRERNS